MPSWIESWVRSEAPTWSGESTSRSAHTGAPAWASTAAVPALRSSVLLPDMLEPETISTRGRRAEAEVVAHAAGRRDQRVAEAFGLEARLPFGELRKARVRALEGEAGERREGLELADGVDPAPEGGAGVGRHASIARAHWVFQSSSAAIGAKS